MIRPARGEPDNRPDASEYHLGTAPSPDGRAIPLPAPGPST